MKRHAIIIGVEDYAHFPRTPFAHADAALMFDTLTGYCDYPVQNASVFKLSPESPLAPAEILRRIREAVSALDREDTVLLYFAGHGHLEDGAGFLVLPDTQPNQFETTALPLSDLTKELRREGRVCFRVFDACHSGIDVRSTSADLDVQGFVRAVTTDGAGWVTLAACRDDEYSVGDPASGHGVFTYALCDYIRSLPPGEFVRPEYARASIAEDVLARSKALGSPQNPTLNASISGNVSLAVRRAKSDPAAKEGGEAPSHELVERVERLRSVADVLDQGSLEATLARLNDAMISALAARSEFVGAAVASAPLAADDIPSGMHRSIIEFTRGEGLQPRHRHDRTVEVEDDTWSPLSSMYLFTGRKRRRHVEYELAQPESLPKSAVLYKTDGDGRCVPALEVIAYVIPLQLSMCLLVSGFRRGWPPDESRLFHLFNGYQYQKPGAGGKPVEDLPPFAMQRIVEKLCKVVEERADQLERELEAS